MSKPRRKYKPKGVRLDVMAWVKSGMLPINKVDHAGVTLKIKNHAALASITHGTGCRDDIDIVIAAMNITEALALLGKGKDWHAEIRAAQDAILTMGKRGLANGDRFLFTGPEMQAVNLAMDVHDAQLDECTVAELEKALNLVANEIKHKRARMIKEEAAA
jgi:hypothetical protein